MSGIESRKKGFIEINDGNWITGLEEVRIYLQLSSFFNIFETYLDTFLVLTSEAASKQISAVVHSWTKMSFYCLKYQMEWHCRYYERFWRNIRSRAFWKIWEKRVLTGERSVSVSARTGVRISITHFLFVCRVFSILVCLRSDGSRNVSYNCFCDWIRTKLRAETEIR